MISLWMDEGMDEASEDMKKDKADKKASAHGCACGRAVCCGKHKNGQCACQQKEGRTHD